MIPNKRTSVVWLFSFLVSPSRVSMALPTSLPVLATSLFVLVAACNQPRRAIGLHKLAAGIKKWLVTTALAVQQGLRELRPCAQ